jgi:RNA polymerase sigma factor (sigma-70 family)
MLMSYKTELSSLEVLASSLPFRLDEADRVNEAFALYMTQGLQPHKVLIDLWTYCFVRRYYLVKFLKESAFRSSELDLLVEKTYQKVERNRGAIESYDRYAQWVSVVCRNTFINFVTRRRNVTGLEHMTSHPRTLDLSFDVETDAAALHVALQRAIAELPEFLRPAARMKFIENLSYEEISRIIGKRVPTVRAYIHKACARFRKNRPLQAWAERVFD